jgi:heme exporter protein B
MRSDWQCVVAVMQQRLLMAVRNPAQLWQPLAFFVLVLLLFPLAVGSDPALLKQLAPGALWVAVLLALLLSLTHSFTEDYRDGTLETWLLAPYPLALIVFAKVLMDWLVAIVPLLLCLPIAALFFHLSLAQFSLLVASLLLGTFAIFGIGSIFSALIVGFRQSSWLLALLLLPIAIPILIFACSAVSVSGGHVMPLAVLGIFALLSLLLCPLVTAASLRLGVQG